MSSRRRWAGELLASRLCHRKTLPPLNVTTEKDPLPAMGGDGDVNDGRSLGQAP
jgi:hypothetical protein